MPQEIMNIIWSALSVIITGLISFGVAKFTQWINTKISDKKAANYINTIMTLVGNSVKTIYQTYVESLKNENAFTKENQLEALNKCLTLIKSQCAPELISYITKNFGDCDGYFKSLIESTIYSLKNKNKNKKEEK